jgi:hypothetical protein
LQPVRELSAKVRLVNTDRRRIMLSPSLALVLLVVGTGLVAVAVLVYAFLRGWIDEDAIERQRIAIFDAEDLQAERPWETPAQRAERVRLYGPPLAAPRTGDRT